jgi:hypothetical protein
MRTAARAHRADWRASAGLLALYAVSRAIYAASAHHNLNERKYTSSWNAA